MCNLVRCSELCDLRYSGSCPASNACSGGNAFGSSGNLEKHDWSDIGEDGLVEETDLMFRSRIVRCFRSLAFAFGSTSVKLN